jgi:hypothetical protein
MHSHDDALIAALAEGSIDPSQAAAAEAAIAACARCAAELEGQRSALTALQAAPDASLREPERAALRSAVASSLGLEIAPTLQPVRRKPIPWGAVAIAAASLAAIVAVVPLAGLLNTASDSDEAATALAVTTAAEEPARLETADATPEPAQLDAEEGVAGGTATEDGTDGVPQVGTAAPTTLAGTTTMAADRSLVFTVDDLAAVLATGDLDPLVYADGDGACAVEAEAKLGAGAVPLARRVLVNGIEGIAYLAGDRSAAAVFDPVACRSMALLP